MEQTFGEGTGIQLVIVELSPLLPKVQATVRRFMQLFIKSCRTLVVSVGNASPTSLFNICCYLIMCYLFLLQAGHTQNMRVQLNFFFLGQVYFFKVGYFQRLDKDKFFFRWTRKIFLGQVKKHVQGLILDKYCLYNWTCIACTRTSKITCTACTCIPIGHALLVHVYKLDMYCLYILACQRLYFFFLDKSKFLGQVLHVQNSLYNKQLDMLCLSLVTWTSCLRWTSQLVPLYLYISTS